MGVLRSINLGVRFLLELAMFVAFGIWGVATGESAATRVVLGVGAPMLAIATWGLFVAPRARWLLRDPAGVALELALFGLAAVALFSVDRLVWGIALGVAAIVNIGLLFVFDQRQTSHSAAGDRAVIGA